MHKSSLKLWLVILFFTLTSTHLFAAYNSKNLWPIWEVNNPLSKEVISHHDWQHFLKERVITNHENINLVDYPSLNKEDRQRIKRYLKSMSMIKIDHYNRDEQLAFWINVYNAIIVDTVASYYPVSSIEEINISPGLFSVGPWGAKIITINNVALSLDDIQNRIIRPIWNDVRALYAINNGSIGAANINKDAYQGATIDDQLNEAAFTYINSLRGAQVIENKLIISKLYEWFSEDFGGTRFSIIKHLKQFAHDPLQSEIKHINTIDNYMYNWHLNSTVKNNDN